MRRKSVLGTQSVMLRLRLLKMVVVVAEWKERARVLKEKREKA